MTREEAIKIAYGISGTKAQHEALEFLIPELVESEDERIRNDIMKAVENWLPYERVEEIRTYLEKQKEQKHYWKPTETNVALFNKAVTTNKTLTPAERAQLDIIRFKFGCCRAVNCSGIVQKEQKPEDRFEEAREKYQVEWSEEDENVFNDILLDMADRREMFKAKGETIFAENTQKKIDWLDSHHLQLKYQFSCPQPKQEWSEEDESYLQTVISELEVSKKEAKKYEHKTYDAIISWLKSLRPSWKPSEHQMSILKAVKDYVGRGSGYWGEGLGSLIEDLEKLM